MTGWHDLALALRAQPDNRLSERDARLEQVTGGDSKADARHKADPRPRVDPSGSRRRLREETLAHLFGHAEPGLFAITTGGAGRVISTLSCTWAGDDHVTVSDGKTTVAGGRDGTLVARGGCVEHWERGRRLRKWRGSLPK